MTVVSNVECDLFPVLYVVYIDGLEANVPPKSCILPRDFAVTNPYHDAILPEFTYSVTLTGDEAFF